MADPYAEEFELIPCCRHLRTKMQQCAGADMRAGPGLIRVSDTATYWCSRTATSFGPDDSPGTPESCQPGRSCYERNV
jgi:hypothetical protein